MLEVEGGEGVRAKGRGVLEGLDGVGDKGRGNSRKSVTWSAVPDAPLFVYVVM